ncbi:AsmA family protein [Chitinimonas koreensis]|uniref:AsmA family protein n=1 Tax=Chitinimonas koreensis TaxID=356302 RepID=UPI0003F60CB0|nr:AsmA family protein [Chitinimonas koreensis]QNM94782.1 AsmA family protein [Chitinimonas koreensis]
MNKALKYTLIGGGSLLLLAGAAAAYIAATFDPNALKPQIEALVKEKKQRTLKLAGPISLSFFPGIGARLSDVTLSELASDTTFAHVGQARVSLQFWPLLHKKVVVDAVELDGAEVRLLRDAKGAFNFADLLDKQPKEPDAPVDFDVSKIRVKNVRVDFDDRQGKRRIVLDKVALSADGLNPEGARNLDLSAEATLSAPQLAARLAVSLDKLEMDREAGRFLLDDLAAAVEGKLGADALKLKLDAPRVSVAGESAEADAIELDAALDGRGRKLDAKLKLDGLSGDNQRLDAKTLSVDVDFSQPGQAAKLQIASPLAVELDKLAVDLGRLTIKGEVTGGPAKAAPVALDGHLSAGIEAQTVDTALSGKLDGASLVLTASVKGFALPAIRFDLKADALDLDRYFPPAPASAEPAQAAAKPAKVDLSPLRALDLDGRVSVGQLRKAPLDARDVRLAVLARGGIINVPVASMKAFGGDVAATATATATANPRIVLKPRLNNVDIHAVLAQLAHFDRLEGRGTVDGELAVQGPDTAAMKASADGTLRARLSDGALRGINIGKVLRDAKATLANFQGGQQTVASSAGEKTDFTELTATLRLKDGVAHNDDLAIKSPLIRVAGEGEADLVRETLDYLVRASLVNTSKGQDGKDRADLHGLTVPVRIKGPFAQPGYSLDLTAALKDNAGAKIEEKKQEVKEQLKQKTDDAIKKGLQKLFN